MKFPLLPFFINIPFHSACRSPQPSAGGSALHLTSTLTDFPPSTQAPLPLLILSEMLPSFYLSSPLLHSLSPPSPRPLSFLRHHLPKRCLPSCLLLQTNPQIKIYGDTLMNPGALNAARAHRRGRAASFPYVTFSC